MGAEGQARQGQKVRRQGWAEDGAPSSWAKAWDAHHRDRDGGPSEAAIKLVNTLVDAARDGTKLSLADCERLKAERWNDLIKVIRRYWLGEMEAREAILQVRAVLLDGVASLRAAEGSVSCALGT